MTPRRRQRMVFVCVLLVGVATAAVLTFLALGENMLYFFSPSQVKAGEVPAARNVRVGGLVVNGSVTRPGDGLTVQFDLTDNAETISVRYRGILPDLFREGQGVVAMGQLSEGGIFDAEGREADREHALLSWFHSCVSIAFRRASIRL